MQKFILEQWNILLKSIRQPWATNSWRIIIIHVSTKCPEEPNPAACVHVFRVFPFESRELLGTAHAVRLRPLRPCDSNVLSWPEDVKFRLCEKMVPQFWNDAVIVALHKRQDYSAATIGGSHSLCMLEKPCLKILQTRETCWEALVRFPARARVIRPMTRRVFDDTQLQSRILEYS